MLLQVQTSNLITEMTFNYNGTFRNNPWKSSWFLAISILKAITHKMLKETKRQVRYYRSQLCNAFVISDVCNRSLCVIPFNPWKL